jgi:hypothetical protein
VQKVGDRYAAACAPPHSKTEWRSDGSMMDRDVVQRLRAAGCHPQDAWDAVGAAHASGQSLWDGPSEVCATLRLNEMGAVTAVRLAGSNCYRLAAVGYPAWEGHLYGVGDVLRFEVDSKEVWVLAGVRGGAGAPRTLAAVHVNLEGAGRLVEHVVETDVWMIKLPTEAEHRRWNLELYLEDGSRWCEPFEFGPDLRDELGSDPHTPDGETGAPSGYGPVGTEA